MYPTLIFIVISALLTVTCCKITLKRSYHAVLIGSLPLYQQNFVNLVLLTDLSSHINQFKRLSTCLVFMGFLK